MFPWLSTDMLLLLGRGVLLTVVLTAVTALAAFVLGIAIGTLRLSPQRRYRWLATPFVELHRNIPALVLIVFWAFAIPNLFPPESRKIIFFDNELINWLSDVTSLPLPYYALAAALGLTLNTAAYLAELFRAGVGTIPRQRVDAARLLGASRTAVFRHILLPQGVQAAFPAMITRLTHHLKNTALASFVAVPEFFQETQTAVSQTFRAVEFLTLAAAVYLLLTFLFGQLLQQLAKWLLPTSS